MKLSFSHYEIRAVVDVDGAVTTEARAVVDVDGIGHRVELSAEEAPDLHAAAAYSVHLATAKAARAVRALVADTLADLDKGLPEIEARAAAPRAERK